MDDFLTINIFPKVTHPYLAASLTEAIGLNEKSEDCPMRQPSPFSLLHLLIDYFFIEVCLQLDKTLNFIHQYQ